MADQWGDGTSAPSPAERPILGGSPGLLSYFPFMALRPCPRVVVPLFRRNAQRKKGPKTETGHRLATPRTVEMSRPDGLNEDVGDSALSALRSRLCRHVFFCCFFHSFQSVDVMVRPVDEIGGGGQLPRRKSSNYHLMVR